MFLSRRTMGKKNTIKILSHGILGMELGVPLQGLKLYIVAQIITRAAASITRFVVTV